MNKCSICLKECGNFNSFFLDSKSIVCGNCYKQHKEYKTNIGNARIDIMNEQMQGLNWIQKELDELPKNKEYEELPGLTFEENKTKVISIDTSKPFDKWESPDGKIKKLIPVIDGTERKLWWLNVQNPIYKELLMELSKNNKTLKILQTGTKDKTKYIIIKY